MYRQYNPNSCGIKTGDCTVRAISKLLDKEWDEVYIGLCIQGFLMCSMPSTNSVWGTYLRNHNCERISIDPITVIEFCEQHPKGKYLLATGTHVVTVENGDYYDIWDSGDELIIYYFKEEK